MVVVAVVVGVMVVVMIFSVICCRYYDCECHSEVCEVNVVLVFVCEVADFHRLRRATE